VYYATGILQKERKNIYNTITRGITTYECEVWRIKEKVRKNY
jgi:hypothetical protein